AVSFCAPSTMRVNSAAEDRRPFIFQLPATSGRRGARTIVVSRVFPNPAKRLAERSRTRQRSPSRGPLAPPYVAMQSPPPYDATTRPAAGSLNHGGSLLRGLRKASRNWRGKAVMAAVVGFLVISFAIWGIGDIFRGFGRSTVAKIGHTEITIEQFRTLYNDRLQQYSRQLGRPISADQARATGLDRAVIG